MTDLKLSLLGKTYTIGEAFLEQYNRPGPRYTSYPTAPEWNDDFGVEAFKTACIDANTKKTPVSLYLHLPFCEKLCLFCGCNVVIKKDHSVALPYLEQLKTEIRAVSQMIDPTRPVVQIHLGGGTPTYLTPAQLKDLYSFVANHFSIDPEAEISIEVDPRVTTQAHIEVLRQLGFNRISMGIQDFDAKVQEAVHRIQPYTLTHDLIEHCRAQGFPSINIDLIYGLPYQTADSFAKTLDLVMTLYPDRIALFSYAHVPWLKKQQTPLERHLPAGMEKFRIFHLGIQRFIEAGYRYIGLDHFAKPDDELCLAQDERTLHRNFQGYTTKSGADLYGLGVSSISGIGATYAQNHRDLSAYAQSMTTGSLATMRGCHLTQDDLLRRIVINRILCHCVLPFSEVESQFGIRFDSYFEQECQDLKPLMRDGLAEISNDTLYITPLGRIFIRNVAMIFDRYLRQKKGEKPIFSKTL